MRAAPRAALRSVGYRARVLHLHRSSCNNSLFYREIYDCCDQIRCDYDSIIAGHITSFNIAQSHMINPCGHNVIPD